MSEFRVIVYGVWPDLSPSGDKRHYLDRCFEDEAAARSFYANCIMPATLYSIDWSIPELSRRVLLEKGVAANTSSTASG